jgi:polyhydroxyalkanoate synthesis repressor PhaR
MSSSKINLPVMPQKTILIKKYENRRLYDATNSRYVNLEEVAGFLKNGHDVRVVDVVTGKDITRLILTQIIIEDARTPDSTFPVDVLRQMIAASGRASQESALRYMKAMLDMYQDTYRAIPPAVNPFEFFRPGAARAAAPDQGSAPTPENHTESGKEPEVDELKQRVAELEKLVSSLASGKPAARKSARKK